MQGGQPIQSVGAVGEPHLYRMVAWPLRFGDRPPLGLDVPGPERKGHSVRARIGAQLSFNIIKFVCADELEGCRIHANFRQAPGGCNRIRHGHHDTSDNVPKVGEVTRGNPLETALGGQWRDRTGRPRARIGPVFQVNSAGALPGFPYHGPVCTEPPKPIRPARHGIGGPVEGYEQPPRILVAVRGGRFCIVGLYPGLAPVERRRPHRQASQHRQGDDTAAQESTDGAAPGAHGVVYPSVSVWRKAIRSSMSAALSAGAAPGLRSNGGS